MIGPFQSYIKYGATFERRTNWWLRDVCNATNFANVNNNGNANNNGASNSNGVRPDFGGIGISPEQIGMIPYAKGKAVLA